MNNHCTFCDILENKHENKTYIATLGCGSLFLNLNQHYTGRCLYILNDHCEYFHTLDDDVYVAFNNEVKKIGAVLNDLLKPDLINYALLGNHVQHVHWHIIPRYKNDGNWGHPPWPTKVLELSDDEYRALSLRIRERLMGDENGAN